MSVTEAERHHLYEVLKSHFGAAPADTLMNLIPPSDWSEFATTSDVERLGARIDQVEVQLGARVESLVLATRAELGAEISAVRADLMRTFGTWLFASQAAVIASVAVIVAVLG